MPDVSLDIDLIRSRLLAWYDAHARSLPWRAAVGAPRTEPYRVWLSEVMLQQTTVLHATPYFQTFTTRWPTVSDLAAAEDAEVMGAWAGLGYYARARNLLACARAVAGEHGGVFPDTEAALLALPGVGAYTAAAVASIAFDRAANVVDGNVERVMARLFAVETPIPAARPELRRLASLFVTDERPGDWAQSLMDLGATVCRPKSPSCGTCPVASKCLGLASGDPARFPMKAKKAERPHRRGVAYVLVDNQGRVAVETRPDKGLLGGMLGLPTSDWTTGELAPAAPVVADWREAGAVEHVFTHFSLTLTVMTARVDADGPYRWMPIEAARAALPTVFAKALDRASAPDLFG
ncbi:A/G-specific adenine glycosylase [Brevundimonas sp. BT-123]|uniref:A/G-specific adenine glycosylase n=1 Tax=Brevundimonas sp. BT-123 TaxID=2986928 RepID=UPI002235BAF7|nr:A/G-specific adenine glycosylase [Brevundimonas sp. BT-123]MCW0045617.1 A/G-specific adenine glycosylase [Brevundimonas sp. BT-123]